MSGYCIVCRQYLSSLGDIGWTMSLFDFAKICLFSEVNGVVVNDGNPIAGAEVIQTVIYGGGKEVRNSTTTNSRGEFHFDALFTHSISTLLPGESVYAQGLVIKYDRADIEGWTLVKRSDKENAELGGEKINLLCDINAENLRQETPGNGVLLGICRWK